MKKLVLHITLLINLTLCCYQQTNAQCHIDDWTALKALYESTNGDNWTNKTGWEEVTTNTPSNNCNLESLFGISLDGVGRVSCIDLNDGKCHTISGGYEGNKLTGNIPPEIGNLTNLTYLEFRGNQLSGNLPPEIGNLSSLKNLVLDNNQLSGSIPIEFGNLSNLIELEIDYNQLSGSIPVELSNLSNLEEIDLDYNQLSGNIPAELGDLSNLTEFDLYNNQLNGNIPITLGKLNKLDYLNLGLNQLAGTIPLELGNLKNLTNLRLASNQLSGNIPSTLGNLSSLTQLRLNSNQLNGNIPVELYKLKNLTDLRLNNNQLEGKLLPELGNLNKLRLLSLHNNKFSGNIPPEMGNLNGLKILNLNNNQFSGLIPVELSSLNLLIYLNLENNLLSGTISTIIDSLTRLKILFLQKNYFSCADIENAIKQVQKFTYLPQYYTPVNYDSIRINIFDTLPIKQQLTLAVEYSWDDSLDLTYQWKRNSKAIPGAANHSYKIDNIDIQTVGKYTLHTYTENCASNEVLFESISDPIYVFLKGYDLLGQPVAYNQIMVEFDNAEETQKYKNEILFNPDRTGLVGEEAKSCNCNRELYLWEFPTTERAVEALLEIDRKTKSIKKKSNIKGDFNNLLNIGETDSATKAYQIITDSLLLNMSYLDSVLVFILDTGLDEESFNTDPFTVKHAPVDSCYGIEKKLGYSYVDSTGTSIPVTTNYQDEHWHGTYGFHTITENLTENHPLKIVPLKIFDKDGSGNLFDLTCALYHAIDHNADVVNISAGYQGQPSDILESAINYAREKGTFITTATGNESINIDSLPQYPAYYSSQYHKFVIGNDFFGNAQFDSIRYDNVISVTSINENNQISSFANVGKESATIAAYGEYIYGYGLGGTEIIASGTSMATFIVTRELALEIATNKSRGYKQIWSNFEQTRLVGGDSLLSDFTQTGKRLKVQLEVAEISGCTDWDACNYFEFATINDGSCEYESCNMKCYQSDWNALKAIYKSTNGSEWKRNDNWEILKLNSKPSNCNLGDLYGVWLNDEGRVNAVNLYNNNLSDNIPKEIEGLTELTGLFLAANNLEGEIPEQLTELNKLSQLILASNNLSGSIPNSIGNLKNLKRLQLSYNQIDDKIPVQIGQLDKLEYLLLNHNKMKGSLPKELTQLDRLYNLNVSQNQLSGCFENDLTRLCNLSSFQFKGNANISEGNYFESDWEIYCSNMEGACVENSKIKTDEKMLYVYPNPTKSKLFVELPLNKNESNLFSILNLEGRCLLTVEGKHLSDRLFELDLTQLSQGMYIMEFKNNKKTHINNFIKF